MSQAEIDRRKKLQAASSRVGGTLGLASLAAFTASKVPGSRVAARVAPKLNARYVGRPRIPKEHFDPKVHLNPVGQRGRKRLENVALGTSTAGAGLGGVSSYNFAAYTQAEARQRQKKKTIAKSAFGIEHMIDKKLSPKKLIPRKLVPHRKVAAGPDLNDLYWERNVARAKARTSATLKEIDLDNAKWRAGIKPL